MPFPAQVDTVTVHGGPFYDLDSQPIVGATVMFEMPVLARVVGGLGLIVPSRYVATTDADGDFSIVLPASDTAGLDPNGWAYRVVDRTGIVSQTFYVELAAADPTVEYADLVQLATPPPANGALYTLLSVFNAFVATKGQANGLAALDAAGLLPVADVPDLSGLYADVVHTHAQADVTGLAAALAALSTAILDEETARQNADALLATIASVTPGAWTALTLEAGAGAPLPFTDGAPGQAAGARLEPNGVVRMRGAIGTTGSFLRDVTIATLPAACFPSQNRRGILRTRGTQSTHTTWYVTTAGLFKLGQVDLTPGSEVCLDGISFST